MPTTTRSSEKKIVNVGSVKSRIQSCPRLIIVKAVWFINFSKVSKFNFKIKLIYFIMK